MNKILFAAYYCTILFLLISTTPSIAQEPVDSTDKSDKSIRSYIWNEHRNTVNKNGNQQRGLNTYKETKVTYRRDGRPILDVHLKKPIKVYEAEQPHGWGHVQFPRIQRLSNGEICIRWNLTEDDITAQPKYGWKYSPDEGNYWHFNWNKRPPGDRLELPNGDEIAIARRKFKVDSINLPEPLKTKKRKADGKVLTFYRKSDLPDRYSGFHLSREPKSGGEIKSEIAHVNDPDGLVYAQKGLLNVQGWGDIKVANDSSIIKMIYGAYHEKSDGTIAPSGTSFYRSTDNGRTWKLQGRIPYVQDKSIKGQGNRELFGFDEADFEILKNGTMISVMRTSPGISTNPLYISYSYDLGKTWTEPRAFTNNGVLPNLLQLENGVVVLSSGRKGVQLRFNAEGDGKIWTDPFEMLRFRGIKGQVSCGYTGLLATGPDRFLIVYSDFKNRNDDGEIRKAILVREVIINTME